MQSKFRLTGNERFSQIHSKGRSVANNILVARVLPNELHHSRFGFVVGKRVGKAVTRNKVKRRIREAVRQIPVKSGWDIVFIARRGAGEAKYRQIELATHNLMRRTRLLDTDSVTDSGSESPT